MADYTEWHERIRQMQADGRSPFGLSTLEQDLDDLAAEDPDVAAAERRLDEVSADLVGKARRAAEQRAEIEDIGRTWGAP